MFSKLPRWIEVGAFVLALIAGTVNAIGLLGFEHQSVSHLSGTATLVGTQLIAASFSVLHLIGILVSFLVGAALSGWLITGNTLRFGRDYDTLLLIEVFLLLGASALLTQGHGAGHFLASAACGLQNAMVTTYSGAVIRTTHVTGIFTDLDLMLGAALRGDKFDSRKAGLFMLIIVGFILGGTVGAWFFQRFAFYALFFPAGICLLLAISYRVFKSLATSVGRR
ncbi:MAG: DUF1275 domain-containing protein [Paraglaciecola sp.]|nr:DUF1275 domain-containing protein [Paraglaciecola sp.]NCT49068.1 DUF1275 domain-containing protein [Paraglaciecola sp.]